MYKYVEGKPYHRQKVGVVVGRHFLTIPVDQKFVLHVLDWKYHANKVLTVAEKYFSQDFMLELSRLQP